ncbi:MAG: M48 family metallopeptidase [Planctomycetaceae bacterium]|nr:M48 family metallopeptidase [Planctomycetaceae bacterium]
MNSDSTRVALLLTLAACCLAQAGCRSAPVTGRPQMLLLPETQEVSMGLASYQDIVAKEPASTSQAYVDMVERVGQRIAAVAGKPDYHWEFRVIASDVQNAFCLPGGKVAVYEGILPICESEAGLAVVMSHEVAHALARHGGERMSQSLAVDGVKQAVSYATQKQEQTRREILLKAYGVASEYGVILPYSRKHESEADHIGLMLMAKAGYDPSEAPRFWERFALSEQTRAQQGDKPLEFLSTHPSDARRASDLTAHLPEAMKLYVSAPTRYGMGEGLAASHRPAPAPPVQSPVIPASTGAIQSVSAMKDWWSPQLLATPK